MSPLPALVRVALLAFLALAGRATRADDGATAPAQAAATATAAGAGGPRLRATHRVDVIGPGERVETVIDRLRAARPPHDGAASGRPGRAGPSVRPDSRADPRSDPRSDLRPEGHGDGRSEGARPESDDGRSPGSMGPLPPPAGGGRMERSGESEGERPHR